MTKLQGAAHDDLIYFRESHPDAAKADEVYFRGCYDLGNIDEPWPDYWAEVQRQDAADPVPTPQAKLDAWLAKGAHELWSMTDPTGRNRVQLYAKGKGIAFVIRYPEGGFDLLTACSLTGIGETLRDADARLGVRS